MARKIFIILVVVLLLSSAGLSYYAYVNMQPVVSEGKASDSEFIVHKGESLFSVLDRLESEKLIRNARIVKAYVRIIRSVIIKNGNYTLNGGMSPGQILDLLVQGRQELLKVTIPEGLTASQVADILLASGVIDSKEKFLELLVSPDFIASLSGSRDNMAKGESLKGYLYPDTYYFQKDFPVEKVISYMVETFFRTLDTIYPYHNEFSPEKMKEKIILASIIEKEYRAEEEAPLIASVFYNRLNVGMPLQSCATVIYVLTEEQGKPHPDRIFLSHLKIESPYNTYFNQSLPPGPICNPGRVALDAAFNPAQTDYLFFVVKDSAAGTHTFTSNLADHNVARQDYLSGFRSK